MQSLLTKPYFTRKQLEDMVSPFNIELQHFVSDSNELFHEIGLELRFIQSDFDNCEYYGICQTLEDTNASESLGLKAEVVQFFFRFIDAVISQARENNSCSLTKEQISSIAPPELPQGAIKDMISELSKRGYIEKIHDNFRIGPRGLLEFRPTFTQMASNEEIQTCSICLDFVLSGIKCSRCNTYMHKRCQQSLGQEKWVCPTCNSDEQPVEFGI
ncbi:non-structural maintenance of chromosomes element 1 [Histomonas meleagridis]|uniref:non-structural maintenance of chromosomes element 1-like n=1 Tax=Histomonas meleagridis TaxID=135588 RepID=UPI003559E7D9|nr:non-structural maintenance of chromosomes element 1 [Histomonas meleagridis]KAH0800392.1 non-structural maintenance of chromosomes element 1-like [Histomonas meleagridis]